MTEIIAKASVTPTLTIPAPEIERALFMVPTLLRVVFPEAFNVIVLAARVFEIVMVLRLLAKSIPAPATKDTLPVEALSENVCTDGPNMVIVDRLLWRVMNGPATNDTLPVEALRVKLAPPPPPVEGTGLTFTT